MGFAEGMTIVYGVGSDYMQHYVTLAQKVVKSGWIVWTNFQPSTVLDYSI